MRLQSLLPQVVKPGTALHGALRESYLAVRERHRVWDQARRLRGVTFTDIHNRKQWLALLAALDCAAWSGDVVSDPVGYVLDAYFARHAEYPSGLSDGAEGAFALALYAELAPEDAARVRAVFDNPPGAQVQQHYDYDPREREQHPLALTAVGRLAHVRWLLYPLQRARRGIDARHVTWFALQCAEDPTAGIAPTYVRNPAWQAKVPDGLATGRTALVAYAASQGVRLDGAQLLPVDVRWRSFGRDPVDGVNVMGYLTMVAGLGVSTRNTVQALKLAGYGVSERDIRNTIEPEAPILKMGLEAYPVTLVHLTPGYWTQAAHRRTGLWRRGRVYRIGVWYWELEEAPAEWRHQCDYLDEVWGPTRFIADCLRKVMHVPVVDMMPGIELPRFVPRARAQLGVPEDRFVFLYMFDMNSTFARKNPLAVIRAYREAFAATEPVHVVIKVINAQSDMASFERLKREAAKGGVTILNERLSRPDVYALVDACDAYVSLHRSEGYGMTLAEAMGLGKPTIGTGYSGNLDFMDDTTSKLVGYRKVAIEHDVGPFRKGQVWTEPDVHDAARCMRWVYDNPAEARAMGERAREHIARVTSLEAYGERIRRRLSEL